MDDIIELFSQRSSTTEYKLDALGDWIDDVKNEIKEDGKTSALYRFTCVLRELVLSHRWQDVIQVISQIVMEASGAQDIVHHLGFEVFLQEPTLNYGLITKLTDQIKLLSKYDTRQILLDFFMYLLSQQHFESVNTSKNCEKFGPRIRSGGSDHHLRITYRAYEGLLYYVKWTQLKSRVEYSESKQPQSDTDNPFGEQGEETTQLADREHLRQHKERACTCFEVCMENTGVWDVFITKWVEMLEYHDDVEAARRVLEKYFQKNQDNPYVLSIFHDFLKRNGDNGESDYTCLNILKALCEKVPFGECVLDLYKHYEGEEGEEGGAPLRLKLLFTLLDYPKWKDNTEVWQLLAKEMARLMESGLDRLVSALWTGRSDWWEPYHFTYSPDEDTKLQCWKAASAVYLYGKDADYVRKVLKNDILDSEQHDLILQAISISDT